MNWYQLQKKKINSIEKIISTLTNLNFKKSKSKSYLINSNLINYTILPKSFYFDFVNKFYGNSKFNIINLIKKFIIIKYLKFNWIGLYNNYFSQFQVIINNINQPKYNISKKKTIDTIFGFKISKEEIYCCKYGFYAPEVAETFLILNIINKYKNFIDVGSNLGFYSSLVSTFKKKVFCIEPNRFCIQKSKKNKYIKKFNLGFGDKTELKFLHISNIYEGGATLNGKLGKKYKYRMKTKLIKLDDFVKKNRIKKKTLIKIDCEGYESKVLFGGLNYINKYKPDFLIDIRHKSQFDFFKKNNYRIFPILSKTPHNRFILLKEMKRFKLSKSIQNAYCVKDIVEKEKKIKLDLRFFSNPKILDIFINNFKMRQ